MSQTYMHHSTRDMATKVWLHALGLTSDKMIEDAGYIEVKYLYPEYDEYQEYITPAGNPIMAEEAGYFVQSFNVFPLDTEELGRKLSQMKGELMQKLNERIAKNITDGFTYRVNGEALHFSYDSIDQGNFTDAALASQFNPDSLIPWNGWENWQSKENKGERVRLELTASEFQSLYLKALEHKESCLQTGANQKSRIEVAPSIPALREVATDLGL